MPNEASKRIVALTPATYALTGRQAAELLGMRPNTFYTLAREPHFPQAVTLTDGGSKRWLKDELMTWCQSRPRVAASWQEKAATAEGGPS